jgi:hypothetical protein
LHRVVAVLAGAACVGLGAAVLAGAADGAVFNVTGQNDGVGPCAGSSCPTLRSAILASNATAGPNTIDVPAGEYTLTLTPSGPDDGMTGDLHITTNVTITGAGPGSGGTTIVGTGDRIFDVSSGASAVTLSGMAITGGSQQQFGGAIQAAGGALTLMNDSLIDNTASSFGFGGAIDMNTAGDGSLTVTNTTFSSNTAAASGSGGGGFGGAIMFEPGGNGTMTITDSTFDSNTAQSGTTSGGGFGGAVMFEPGGTGRMTITGSTFSSNASAGSSTQGGFGGGLMFEPGAAPSALTVTNSTFTGNHADGRNGFGGAIMFEPGSGSTGTLTHVTIAGNSTTGADEAGGILVEDAPTTIRNSIISGNTAAGAIDNCTATSGGQLSNAGHNIELGTSCGFDVNADPNLAPLAENGGPTKTMALPAGSPAIDAADPAFCPPTDQRGVARPDGGTGGSGSCDLGAFELVVPPVRHTLTVALLGTGSGTIAGAGVACPGVCSAAYPAGTTVKLAATPTAGSTFSGWSGAGCSGTAGCAVTMSANQTITATFTANERSAPHCTLRVDTKVPLPTKTRPKRRGARRARSRGATGAIAATVRCDQAAKVKLAGTLTEALRQKRKHGKRHSVKFRLGPLGGSVSAGVQRTLLLRLPNAALTALAHRAKESATLILTAANANGTTTTKLTVARLNPG